MAANAQAICSSFKKDLMDGLHAFGASVIRGATTKDTFYAALYLVNQSLGAATTAYSSSGELAASGNYVAGGIAVTNATAPSLDTTTAIWTPSASLVWSNLTSSGSFDCVLIYNYTAAGVNAVSVHTFGAQSVTGGTFTLSMPTDNGTTGLLRVA